ncbi:hypothetical protein MKEN_00104400 [Mycena kentingensis (nom. inval.)]|nr:hypothetical protein MKEN_00104400 [Mycena kentingensis (nom. inval.)]
MSHLTRSPFHRPSPFQFPADRPDVPHLPERAQTLEGLPHRSGLAEHSHQLPTPQSMSIIGGQDPHANEYFDSPSISAADGPASRLRRAASSIVYHHSSGLREGLRDRAVQRSSRSFLVVLPPSSLPQDHGHLGHTLSSGPRNRLSQGLLMPLFPTMYGQLTAIAREFNFPSTTGLCLYLHINENGISATPRIADDSWQMIWSHVFESTSSPGGGGHHMLPVCGKIEFDIDLRVARWYGAWMASSHREQVDVPMSVTPSAAPSVVYYREESRTSFVDGEDHDTQSISRPIPRHVPRKLSLVDRFDTMSARSVPRSVVARPHPEPLPISQSLSPIFQEDEPKTAKFNDLEHRVNSWRASASLLPQTTGILLAGTSIPISPPLDESPLATGDLHLRAESAEEEEYRIEDFSFSISSAGPGDYDPYSPLTWFYDPSIHMAHRAQGSVCMTPTECTSFGPSDYTLSPRFYDFDLHDMVHTPDLAQRMFEDVPPSPSIATSWGAPESFPSSPASEYRAPSIHLADRGHYSRPTTPMTATSWGAPESFPPSPTSEYHAPSIHLADRGHYSRPTTPTTATSWGAPESFPPSPTTPFYVETPDAGQRSFDLDGPTEHPWTQVWPYTDAGRPYGQVWPYLSLEAPASAPEGPWSLVWPYFQNSAASSLVEPYTPRQNEPWAMVWPNMQLQQPRAQPWLVWPFHRLGMSSGTVPVALAPSYPIFDLYPAVYPFNLDSIYPPVSVESLRRNIDVRLASGPSVYPQCLDEIYPSIQGQRPKAIEVALPVAYPAFNLYPATYPYNLDTIYPSISVTFDRQEIVVRLASGPPVYPQCLDEIYPVLVAQRQRAIDVVLPAAYPWFSLYAAVYPFNLETIYPRVSIDSMATEIVVRVAPGPSVYPQCLDEIYPAIRGHISREIDVTLQACYPTFNLYPAVAYPHNLETIYPSIAIELVSRGVVIRLAPGPALYPQCLEEIYPDIQSCRPRQIDVVWPAAYPTFNLFPAVAYPFNLSAIYPAIAAELASRSIVIRLATGPSIYPQCLSEIYPASLKHRSPVEVTLDNVYPTFNLYPAVYPYIEPYPAVLGVSGDRAPIVVGQGCYPVFDLYPPVTAQSRPPVGISMELGYPVLDIYAAVYPHIEPYPPVLCVSDHRAPILIGQNRYPVFNLYPAVYPYVEPYPPQECQLPPPIEIGQNRYPVFNLYPAVYPHVEPYPPQECQLPSPIEISTTSRYPFLSLYRAVYPHFELYPSLVAMPQPLKNASRNVLKSHQELHLAVFPLSSEIATPSGVGIKLRRQHKSHYSLHTDVFPVGVDVSTPSGNVEMPSISPRITTRLRSGWRKANITNNQRGSVAFAAILIADWLSPAITDAVIYRPSSTSAPDGAPASTRQNEMPPLPKAPSLSRSTSMALPSSRERVERAEVPAPLERSVSVSGGRPMLRKRDSMVLQRVRALQMHDAAIQEEPRPTLRKLAS